MIKWGCAMSAEFDEIITGQERLREIIGKPSHRILGKVIDHIDEICAKYIAASPYVIVATRGADARDGDDPGAARRRSAR